MSITRREALSAILSSLASLSASQALAADAGECVTQLTGTDLQNYRAALTNIVGLDVHCHIFNSADIPWRDFLEVAAANGADFNQLKYSFASQVLGSALMHSDVAKIGIAMDAPTELKILELIGDGSELSGNPDVERDFRTHLKAANGKYQSLLQGLDRFLSANPFDEIASNPAVASKFKASWLPLAKSVASTPDDHQIPPPWSRPQDKSSIGGYRRTELDRLTWALARSRLRNFQHLQALYGRRPGTSDPDRPVASIFTPSLVDFEYWLTGDAMKNPDARTKKGSTPPIQQIEVMAAISRAYPGEMFPIVGFCPWRHLDDVHRGTRPTALEVVKDAILQKGCVGVKLYPPMGFRPWNNGSSEDDRPACLAEPSKRFPYALEFGSMLNSALTELYDFCIEHDVPIMAHTASSNAARYDYGQETPSYEYTNPRHWAGVLNAKNGKWRGLRLNLAHFAFYSSIWRHDIGILMDLPGSRVYADLSHFDRLLLGSQCKEAKCYMDIMLDRSFLRKRSSNGKFWNKMEAGITKDYQWQTCEQYQNLSGIEPTDHDSWLNDIFPPAKGTATALRRNVYVNGTDNSKSTRWQRLMFGSDWSMMSKEKYHQNYLKVLAQRYYLHTGKNEKWLRAFMGGNALQFLGLAKEGEKRPGNRQRIEKRMRESFGWSSARVDAYFSRIDQLVADIGS